MQMSFTPTLSVTTGKKAVVPQASFVRISKLTSPSHSCVDSCCGGNISYRRAPAINTVLPTPSATAAAEFREADITHNGVGASFLSIVGVCDSEEAQLRSQIHQLQDFTKLYKVKKVLGCGSYSVVFQVMHCVTRELKAAKFIIEKEKRSEGRQSGSDCVGYNSWDSGDRILNSKEKAVERGDGKKLAALSENLVKEITVSLKVCHPNLVHTSDVFVGDAEDLWCRMQPYIFNPPVVLSALNSSGSKWDINKKGDTSVTARKSLSPHGFRHCDTLNGSVTDGASYGGCCNSSVSIIRSDNPCDSDGVVAQSFVHTFKRVLDSVTGTKKAAIDKMRWHLEKGKVHCIIVMELLGSCDLFTLAARNPLDEGRVAAYMLDLFLALKYLHSCHIVHRDVKVENIVLDSHDRARLIDYGFCESLQWPRTSTLESEGNGYEKGHDAALTQFCGSYHYVAPEVIRTALQRRLLKANCTRVERTDSGNDGGSENNSFAGVQLPPISVLRGRARGGVLAAATAAVPQESSGGNGVHVCLAGSASSLHTRLACRPVGYGTQADLWSAGVVMFVLLHSAFPFHDTRMSKLLSMITFGRQQVRLSPLLSSDAKNLLRQLLTDDAGRRLTAVQAVEHPWFKKVLGERRRTE